MSSTSTPVLIFVSDHHIGGDNKLDTFDNSHEFITLLDQLEREHNIIELVLLGDFLELLQITPTKARNKIEVLLQKQEYKQLFQRLLKFSKKHSLVYILGNHDQELYWNMELQHTLADYGIVIKGKNNLSFVKHFTSGKRMFTIYAEHGNQFDPQNSFEDYSSKTETPLGHHLMTDFTNKAGKLEKQNGRAWLHDVSNVRPLELLPQWFVSNYFYEELHRLLKIIAVPILLGFIITRLIPLYFLFKLFNVKFFSLALIPRPLLIALIVIIALDMTFIFFGVIAYVIKRDVMRTLRNYGITQYDELMRKRSTYYNAIGKRILEGERITITPLASVDLFIHGHTHHPELKKILLTGKRREKGYANTGSWHRGVIKLKTMFGFPPVFAPSYELTYLKIFQQQNELIVQQWEFGKTYALSLTSLQRIAIFGKKVALLVKKKNKIVKELTFTI